ncbi:hypothetical protein DW1_2096 [Proteiniborus sp. DW1]|uniref:hypothetical protein n=1 Tax=Proteiniborus sp. DW1 TaxID=1889883 RepID=UPI00092E1ED9|nr:hypothetical protein [Proteiniborus sp. DW1]SCG83662.1 hypothetical protein DW1_2096 [Proteiniborus sp. DW1]
MKELFKNIKKFHDNEDGDIVQTGITIGIFAIIAVGALTFLGPKIRVMFNRTGESLDEGASYQY